jgi:hypothetical protein
MPAPHPVNAAPPFPIRAAALAARVARTALLSVLLVPGALASGALLSGGAPDAFAAPADVGIDYDIVYVRYPRNGDAFNLEMPMGELPDLIERGADLVLLHPDGSEVVLVGCRDTSGWASYVAESGDVTGAGVPAASWPACSVQDPVVSYDGNWVYYAKYVNVNAASNDLKTDAYIFKMRLRGAGAFQEIQLTNGGTRFTNDAYGGHSFPADDVPYGVRDLGPAVLPNGDIVFTSTRSGLVPPRTGTNRNINPPHRLMVSQLYRMSDHDGSTPNKNLRVIGHSSMHLVQHPTVLHDGRLLFANWDDVGVKMKYSMLTLYLAHPDGSDITMFMEPFDYHKRLDHFPTQLANGDAVSVSYYVGSSWGFGVLFRSPTAGYTPEFQLDDMPDQDHYRPFARRGTVNMTPHTNGTDKGAPNDSGRYSTPTAAPDNGMLVAYSPGPVDPNDGGPPMVNSGIYLVPNATTVVVTDPGSQLRMAKNDPNFNEMWPRAAIPYLNIHGITKPAIVPDHDNRGSVDARLPEGTPFALFGTSSMYNRESAPLKGDPFNMGTKRETTRGNWLVQGAQAGRFSEGDIWGVRLIEVVPKPYRAPYSSTAEEKRVFWDDRLTSHVEGFVSHANERWRILGEIPVHKVDGSGNTICNTNEPLLKRDADGLINPDDLYVSTPAGPCGLYSPDTSFLTRIPADTTFFAQGIDKNGMTLFSELTWRHEVAGEKRTNCGGCHAHTIPAVDFDTTEAAKPGYAVWDMATRTPYVSTDAGGNPVVKYRTDGGGNDVGDWGVEFNRDILPILNDKCVSCHDATNNTTGTDLVLNDPTDPPYWRLARDHSGDHGGPLPAGLTFYPDPQMSKYIRAFQARESLLIWKIFGARLDGRANGDRSDDLDYTGTAMPPPGSPQLTDEEKRLIARWVDLGAPMDLDRPKERYTEDDMLPVVAVAEPARGMNPQGTQRVVVGLFDGDTGIDMSTLSITLNQDLAGFPQGSDLSGSGSFNAATSVLTVNLPSPLPAGTGYLLTVSAQDNAGNARTEKISFDVASTGLQPVKNVTVILVP